MLRYDRCATPAKLPVCNCPVQLFGSSNTLKAVGSPVNSSETRCTSKHEWFYPHQRSSKMTMIGAHEASRITIAAIISTPPKVCLKRCVRYNVHLSRHTINVYTVSQPNQKVAVFHGHTSIGQLCQTLGVFFNACRHRIASYDLHLADQLTVTD